MNKLTEGEQEINLMYDDIQQNMESVYNTNLQNYKAVMDAFKTRISGIERMLGGIREKGIRDVEFRKIEFTGVSESLNSLSEMIIPNCSTSTQGSDGASLPADDNRGSTTSAASNPSKNKANNVRSSFNKLKPERTCESTINSNRQYLQPQQDHTNHSLSQMMFSFDGQKTKPSRDHKPFKKD
jgi:hypothetical protein